MKKLRVGFVEGDGWGFRPLMGLRASRDGGLIMWPAEVPGRTWEYSLVRTPSGPNLGTAAAIDDDLIAVDHPPKIHYHRSGWVSSDQTGNTEKRAFTGVPMADLDGEQVFSLVCSRPFGMPVSPRQMQRGAMFARSYPPRLSTARINGYLFALPKVKDLIEAKRPTDGPGGVVPGTRPELVVDLSGHGLDVLLVLRIDFTDEPPIVPGQTHSVLGAFNTATVRTAKWCETVAAWTPNPGLKPLQVTSATNSPFGGRWRPLPADTLHHRTHPPAN